ncbi:MAG: sigma-54-dependent transcriptional regulator [Pseudobdellovibrionaceae bacterium]
MSQLSLPTILVLDDEKNIRQSIEIALAHEKVHIISCHEPAAALRVLNEQVVDLILLDIQLGEIDGLSFFNKIKNDGFDIPTIFISGQATLTQASQAIKMGGYDFLEKPFGAEKLALTVQHALQFANLSKNLQLAEVAKGTTEIQGNSKITKDLVSKILQVANTNANVHISGESGTGKELAANALHANSDRRNGPFVKVNCSAFSENIIESELFGHEKGAFTGALQGKKGYFELAHRGTIFLDEIGDLSLAAQAKLLRVLQSGEIQKVGSERIVKVDVRILSGTHKDLKALVANSLFREDLYYRLNVVPLTIPSLRDRKEDIPLLVQFMAHQLCIKNNLEQKKISPEVCEELQRYNWPGNVRELQNVIERMLILGRPPITVNDIPEEVRNTTEQPVSIHAGHSLKEFRDLAEREFIIARLRKNKGNISKTATELDVGRTYLHQRLSNLGIEKKDYFI